MSIQKANDAKKLAFYISCLSIFESKTSTLYNRLSERTDVPLAKSLLLSISQDSAKHSTLLEGIGKSIFSFEPKVKDCEKNLGQTWQILTTFLRQMEEEHPLPLAELSEKLMTLESSAGEEYYIFTQMQTLEYMTKEINQLYNISLDRVKLVFESIIKDEEHHREILATLKELSQPITKDLDNTPLVKFQSPDRWINYSSSS